MPLACSIALLAASGSWDRSPPPGAPSIKLALNWVPEPEFGGFYAARDGGACKSPPRRRDSGRRRRRPVVQMVAAARADFGSPAPTKC